MKINTRLLPLLLLVPAGITVPHAQSSKNRVGYVNVQSAVKTMPGSSTYLSLIAKADQDLGARQKTLQALAKTANATRAAKDINALNAAQKSFNTAQAAHMQAIQKAFQPLATKLNPVIAKVARANGYSVVLDQRTAAQSNLVVYANPAVDLTAAVLKALK